MTTPEKKPRKKKDILTTPTLSPNQLTLEAIDSIAAEYDEQKEVRYEYQDKEFIVKVDKKFKLTKITEMMNELIGIMFEIKNNGIQLEEKDMKKFNETIGSILVLKYFSDLPIRLDVNPAQLLKMFDNILNIRNESEISLFEFVWNQGFDVKELEWMNGKIMQIVTNIAKNNTEANDKILKDMEAAIEVLKQSSGVVESAELQ